MSLTYHISFSTEFTEISTETAYSCDEAGEVIAGLLDNEGAGEFTIEVDAFDEEEDGIPDDES